MAHLGTYIELTHDYLHLRVVNLMRNRKALSIYSCNLWRFTRKFLNRQAKKLEDK